MNKFLEDVQVEADKAIAKHGNFNSLHEAYAVTLEEIDELWDEVRKKQSKRNHQDVYNELVQIAACCLKTTHILKLEQ